MADAPLVLDEPLGARLMRALDVEAKLPRAIEALGPVSGREVALVGGADGRAAALRELGARVTPVDWESRATLPLADASVDVVVAWWSAFRGVDPDEVAETDRVLRPGGRLLVVHDYGRDDVSLLRGDLPEYGLWGRRDGPFLRGGFRIRVVHCWWTFSDLEDAREFLSAAFGARGDEVGASLTRPRLSWNVAVYHRSRPEPTPVARTAATAATAARGS